MEIEIITTKKKLSKSLINQMQGPSILTLEFGTGLGYLINVCKDSYKVLLIRRDNEFFILPMNWEKGKMSVYRRIGKWSQTRNFESEADCNSWWNFYQARMREAIDQIYI